MLNAAVKNHLLLLASCRCDVGTELLCEEVGGRQKASLNEDGAKPKEWMEIQKRGGKDSVILPFPIEWSDDNGLD